MEFIAKIDGETGEFVFPSKKDKYLFKQFVDFYQKNGAYFRFQLVENIGHSTANQIALFKRLVVMDSILAQTGIFISIN